MAYQAVFRRYELKYMLTAQQKVRLLQKMAPYMALDKYGRTTICNLYFDTPDYLLIRRSIEKPVYKEKLRVRSYGQAAAEGAVYVELKKKYKSVVYKRRVSMPEKEALAWLSGGEGPQKSQIADEINYVRQFYGELAPKVYLSYEREAYYAKDGSDFRVTFDDTILCRQDRLSLEEAPSGTPILPEDMALMELKCSGGIPLWMTAFLTEERIFKTSYSKYGTAYKTLIFPHLHEAEEEEVYDDE